MAAQRLRQLETIHVGRFDIGDYDIDGAAVCDVRQSLRTRADAGDVEARGLQDRREHVTEESGVVDQQDRFLPGLNWVFFAPEPIGEGKRQEMSDVDDLGRLPLDRKSTRLNSS